MTQLSHVDDQGRVRMVDTSDKEISSRRAIASARVLMNAETVAALTVYDMCKALEKGMTITAIRLEQKTGGKSGDYSTQDGHSCLS